MNKTKFKMPQEKKEEEYTHWEIRFLRENVFMAFGSMMNAYGQINQRKEISIKKFLSDVDEIFEMAIKLTEKALKNAREKQIETSKDFPIKK